jgi:hypothetical protein
VRRFFRFSIRDLFWFVALVAAVLASYWYGKDAGRTEAMATLEGGRVTKVIDGGDFFILEDGEWRYGGRVPEPPTDPTP